jgi:class 3 adenylate cyclase
MRVSTLGGMPDIAHTHFHEFWQLAALRTFGWDRAGPAKRWVEHMTRQFTAESWDQVMTQLEHIDSTPEWTGVTAPTLVIAESGPSGSNVPFPGFDAAKLFRQQIASQIRGAELTIIKPGAASGFAQVAERFFAPDDEQTATVAGGTATILFADIADHTAQMVRLGDTAFREKARPLDEALRNAVRDHGGIVVDGKTLGDGILATFPVASQAIAAALVLEAAAEPTGLGLHIGLHAGDVLREVDADGRSNVFGSAVSIASRISALAPPGEILVSRTVADLARSSIAGVTFEDRGEHALKGIAEPQRVFAVRPEA